MLVYQQPYSLVAGITWAADNGDWLDKDELGVFEPEDVLGFNTPFTTISSLIDNNAVFNYTGLALNGKGQQGTLDYVVNFGFQSGAGTIDGFTETGRITLEAAPLFGDGYISGYASAAKDILDDDEVLKYDLQLFGPNAEEIAGAVYVFDNEDWEAGAGIIFGGAR